MIKIYLPYIYRLAGEIEPLSSLRAGTTIQDNFYALVSASLALDGFLNRSVFASSIRSCRETGNQLLTTVNDLMNNQNAATTKLEPFQAILITNQLNAFRTAMLAEIGVFPSYFVTQKEGFDTLTLLDDGQRLFPADLKEKAPEALFDIIETGKALAYELPTAVGFHVFRATEAVLRRYYSHVTANSVAPKQRTISVYVRTMRKNNCGDEKILSVLEQIGKLHRNPIAHPEDVLTMQEAVTTLGVARSAVEAMLTALPVNPPTTTSP